ncbi:hypothetical protein BJ978_001657 [Agromyces terreus]|uniref:DUF1353 domain-containing protein n=1 Tax=Agromyces terreus TaxID=424795 RepID=A0A9X2H0K4_9MICO|nr:DUF1353 domain-containing protein [Agromyces terreus]MCP2370981.1 hypothetical protein [Agromyces terreus]
MPFLTEDGRPLDELLLAQRPADGDRFHVRAPFVYADPVTGRRYPVSTRPAGATPDGHDRVPGVTDLASVPMWLWSFIASYGRQSAPAILHDERSIVAAGLGDRRAALAQRRVDDRVFRTGLREQRVPLLRSWLMWAWVSADREREFGGAAGWLLIVQAVLGAVVALAASVLAFWQPWWLVALPVLVLASLPWRSLAPLVLVLTGSLAVLGPLVAVHLAALAPLRLIEAVVELVSGGDPRDVLRPTVAPPVAPPVEP